jgi:hypothetical protein
MPEPAVGYEYMDKAFKLMNGYGNPLGTPYSNPLAVERVAEYMKQAEDLVHPGEEDLRDADWRVSKPVIMKALKRYYGWTDEQWRGNAQAQMRIVDDGLLVFTHRT